MRAEEVVSLPATAADTLQMRLLINTARNFHQVHPMQEGETAP